MSKRQLLSEECADVRAEFAAIHAADHASSRAPCADEPNRILEVREAEAGDGRGFLASSLRKTLFRTKMEKCVRDD